MRVDDTEPFPSPRIFPLLVSLIHSVLFALKTTSCAFVDQIKSLTPIVLPESDQSVLEPATAQRALPKASEVRTYPLEAPERIFNPWNVPVPVTSSLVVGLEVPIPIFPPLP